MVLWNRNKTTRGSAILHRRLETHTDSQALVECLSSICHEHLTGVSVADSLIHVLVVFFTNTTLAEGGWREALEEQGWRRCSGNLEDEKKSNLLAREERGWGVLGMPGTSCGCALRCSCLDCVVNSLDRAESVVAEFDSPMPTVLPVGTLEQDA